MDLVQAIPLIALVLVLRHPTVSRLFSLPPIRFEYEVDVGIDAFFVPPVAIPRFLGTMARALRNDAHLRNSYYPIYAGSHSVQLPPAGSPEALNFATHFDRFLSDHLPVIVFSDHQAHRYGWTRRPAPGENNKIMISYKLARAFERFEVAGHENAARLYVVIACTLMHELAHCYGFSCRPTLSPPSLSVAGRTELIPLLDENGQEKKDKNGRPIKLRIGESGYVQEAHFAGFGGRLGVTVPQNWGEDWSTVQNVTLQLGETGQHHEITLQECHEIARRLRSASSTSYNFLEAADPLPDQSTRCKAVEIATATHTSEDWSPTSSVKSRASDDGPMLHIGVTGRVTREPYRDGATRKGERAI